MSDLLFTLARPLLKRLDPERAHDLTIAALAHGAYGRAGESDPASLAVEALGLRFPNPLGLAAGFDKNARVPDAMLAQGFGFVEVGTVTPRPQGGNPRPRLFRLEAEGAVINRMGFNNDGHVPARARLEARKARDGIVGVNIGANKDSDDRIADYCLGLRAFAGLASYFTVNVSSPNTPGLRDLQARTALDKLAAALVETRAELGIETPVLIKIAPDLGDGALDDICDVALERGLDGLILTNTTLTRPGVDGPLAEEAGGLSGRPLMALSTKVLAEAYLRTGGKLLLIGVGGIASAGDAYDKITAGASLVQLYTALAFEGPALVHRIKRELAALLVRDGHAGVADAVGARAEHFAAR